MTTVHLIYASENRDLANRLTEDIGRAGIAFEHHTPEERDTPGSLTKRAAGIVGPSIWLLTDNFLRDPRCMAGAWDMYRTLTAKGQLLTVVADGRERQADGTYRLVPTQFERVGDAIKYMNYWQDVFLKSTDRLREVDLEHREVYDREMEMYRLIANEVGELFSALRNGGYVRWEAFTEDRYALFFRHFGLSSEREVYQQLAELDTEAPPLSAPKVVFELSAATAPPVLSDLLVPRPLEEPEQASVPSATGQPVAAPEPDPEELIRQSIRQAWYWIEKGYAERGLEMLSEIARQHPHHAIAQAEYHRARVTLMPQPIVPEPEPTPIPPTPEPSAPSNGYAPTEADAYNAMGDNALAKGDYLLAKYCWDRVTDLNPNYPDIYRKLALLSAEHMAEDYGEAALHYIEQALAAEPNDPALHYQMAELLRNRLGQSERARQVLGTAVMRHPDHAESWLALAYLAHEAGDAKQAHELYRHAGTLDPKLLSEERDAFFQLPPEEEAKSAAVAATATTEERPAFAPVQTLTVLITGATSGIGLATAEVFARHGHRIIAVGRRAERLEALRERLLAAYPKAQVLPLPLDVRQAAEVTTQVEHLPEEWAAIDVLINNAGLAKGLAPIHEGRLDHWEAMIDTNIKGLLYMTRAVAPGMVRRRRGHIINVSSSAGKEVYPNGNVYCATKFAVEALTRGMRFDLHAYGIRVSQVSPGHTEDTEFALTRFDGDVERAQIYNDFQPLKATDVAEAIYFIATRPPHVNVQDIWLYSTQQASATVIDRSGRAP